MEALADKGYNITALSVDVDPEPHTNLHYIHLDGTYQAIYGASKKFDFLEMGAPKGFTKIIYGLSIIEDYYTIFSNATLSSDGFRTLWNYPDDFKLIFLSIFIL